MTQTTHLALPFIEAAQAQKHLTHNEALALIDALTQLAVSARDVTSVPATPAEGDRVLVGAGGTGAFAGKSDHIATFLAGGWSFLSPRAGWRAYVEAESLLLLYDGAAWIDCGLSLRQMQNLALLGIGATADAANPLLAKLNATLFTAKSVGEGGSGDLRFALNKEGGAKTVSQLYQSNYSARAETGLTGDDNFHVKVSPDGAVWKESILVDSATGEVAFPSGGPTKVRVFTSSGSYTPTPGLRFAEVLLFGGGGSGARTASGAAASGGGGGGGGGLARGRFTAAQIGVSKAVAIGAPGAGGAAQTANSTSGNSGGAGGNTTFGTLLFAGGGGAGSGGGLAAGSGGGGGGGATSGFSASGATGGSGSFGQGNGGSAVGGVSSINVSGFGAGGGGGPATGTVGTTGGISGPEAGASGGGSGGGITAANATSAGGAGGAFYVNGAAVSGAGGAAGVNGTAGPSYANGVGPIDMAGVGGGGGGSHATTPGAGGAGGLGGGGGGDGGASQNGANSGAGGAGGVGYAVIFEFF
ncbi:MAG TPA: DUF2793 domain-containing protein [Methylocystis sp.]|jgi:hypothetical protein